MILFEIKKILSRTGSKVGFLVLLVTLAVTGYFAITYGTYVDENRIRNVKTWLSSDEAKNLYSEAEKEYIIDSYETLETPFYYDFYPVIFGRLPDSSRCAGPFAGPAFTDEYGG